jgi:hypothetical protein
MRFTCCTAELHARFDRALFEATTNQRRLRRPTGENDMSNTIRTTRITTPTRLALLALGAISLSVVLASPASAQYTSTDISDCRSASGIIGSRCLSARSEINAMKSDGPSRGDDLISASEYAAHDVNSRRPGGDNDPNPATRGTGSIETTGGEANLLGGGITGWRVDSNGNLHPAGRLGGGGNGGAAGHTGARIAAPLPPDARTSASVAPPKAAVPKSTTVDKVANTITRDYRTGASAAPGGPPPAAAIGTKPTAPQVAAQTPVVRDHRH